jgi:hypothetical protein
MNEPSQNEVAAAFEYDAERGLLIWKRRLRSDFATNNAWAVWNTKHGGTEAGGIGAKGYRAIRFKGKMRKASRLIWTLANGAPPDRVDHINGNRSDDRIENLRDVSQAENSRNRARQMNNTSGASGVYAAPNGRWMAQINDNGRRRYLGTYARKEDAVAVRLAAAAKAGFHPNHDRTGTRGE